MAEQIRVPLVCKQEGLCPNTQYPHQNLGVASHICNANTVVCVRRKTQEDPWSLLAARLAPGLKDQSQGNNVKSGTEQQQSLLLWPQHAPTHKCGHTLYTHAYEHTHAHDRLHRHMNIACDVTNFAVGICQPVGWPCCLLLTSN